MGASQRIREHVQDHYVAVARKNRQAQFQVRAGTVEKELGMTNRTPQVCNALRSNKFLDANHLRLVRQDGPPSGMSTSVVFTFEFSDVPAEARPPETPPTTKSVYQKLREMRGIAREIYAQLGGADKVLEDERRGFDR